MPSLHDQLMRDVGAPALLAVQGQRQGEGDAPPVRYYEPPYSEALMWREAIIGKLELELRDELAGTRLHKDQRQTTTVTIPAPERPIMRTARVEVAQYPGEPWTIDRFETSGAITRLWLVRNYTEAIQSASVEPAR